MNASRLPSANPGYRPSRVASQPTRAQRPIIGVIITDIQNPFFTYLVGKQSKTPPTNASTPSSCVTPTRIVRKNSRHRPNGVRTGGWRRHLPNHGRILRRASPLLDAGISARRHRGPDGSRRSGLTLRWSTTSAPALLRRAPTDGHQRIAAIVPDLVTTTVSAARGITRRWNNTVQPIACLFGKPSDRNGYDLTRKTAQTDQPLSLPAIARCLRQRCHSRCRSDLYRIISPS